MSACCKLRCANASRHVMLSPKSVIVVSIMHFTLKLAYLYKLTEKKRLIYMHLLLLSIVLCGLLGPQERRKLILPGSTWSSVYIIFIIRLVYMHIVIYNYCPYNGQNYCHHSSCSRECLVVFCGLPGPQENMILPGGRIILSESSKEIKFTNG